VIGQPVLHVPPLPLPGREPALHEAGEVHRDIRLGEPGAGDDRPHVEWAVPKRFQDPQTGGVAEPAEELRDQLVVHISVRLYFMRAA